MLKKVKSSSSFITTTTTNKDDDKNQHEPRALARAENGPSTAEQSRMSLEPDSSAISCVTSSK